MVPTLSSAVSYCQGICSKTASLLCDPQRVWTETGKKQHMTKGGNKKHRLTQVKEPGTILQFYCVMFHIVGCSFPVCKGKSRMGGICFNGMVQMEHLTQLWHLMESCRINRFIETCLLEAATVRSECHGNPSHAGHTAAAVFRVHGR